MKQQTLLFAFVFIALIGNVAAQDQYRECVTGSPDQDTLLLYNFPYWIEVNGTGTLWISNYFADTTNYAQIRLNTGNYSNMTYVASANRFRSFLTSTGEEDTNFTIEVFSSIGNKLANCTGVLRFRIPFLVTFDFFKNSNSTGTEVEAYDNEFQYAVLYYYEPNTTRYSYELTSPDTTRIYDAIGSIFPYYRTMNDPATTTIPVTQDVYLFDKMNSGSAQIKVYENGTYDLVTWNNDINGGLTGLYEFGKPQRNGNSQFRTTVAGLVRIDNETATSYNVFISAWEVYKWHVTKNLIKILLLLIAWGFLALGTAYLTTFWLPVDIRAQGFGYVIGVLALATSPLLIMAARYVWS